MASQELSISFRSEPRESVLQATAEAAGRYGFDVITVYEDLGDPSPMYPLLTFAKHTRTAKVGPAGIAVPKYRSMEPIVGDIARLQSMRPGNTYLGLVPGAWMEAVGLPTATVLQMREAAESATYLLEKRTDGYSGQHYTVKPGFTISYETQGKVPILIGAWGEKMAALAGEIADEIKVGGSANPLMVDVIQRRVVVGAKKVGRQVNDIGIVLGAVTVIDEDRSVAMQIAKERAVVYIDVIGEKDPTVVADYPDALLAIKQAMAVGDVQEAVKHLPDELTTRFLFAGTPADIIRQTENAFAAGASRVEYGAPHGIDQVQGIVLLGEKVLPYFERRHSGK